MQLSASTTYAVAALTQLAELESGEILNCTQICSSTTMPERFLTQILRKLVLKKIVIRVRGVFGGYRLGRPAHKITLLDIVDAVDNVANPSPPSAIGYLDEETRSALEGAFSAASAAARKQLAKITLDSLKPALATCD